MHAIPRVGYPTLPYQKWHGVMPALCSQALCLDRVCCLCLHTLRAAVLMRCRVAGGAVGPGCSQAPQAGAGAEAACSCAPGF